MMSLEAPTSRPHQIAHPGQGVGLGVKQVQVNMHEVGVEPVQGSESEGGRVELHQVGMESGQGVWGWASPVVGYGMRRRPLLEVELGQSVPFFCSRLVITLS